MKTFFIFFVFAIDLTNIHSQTIFKSLNKEEEIEQKIQRDEWIESMHRIEPGVNRFVIDEENVKARNRESDSKNKLNFFSQDTIANLIGKWNERGSGNTAGRIVYIDIDFERNIIFAASSGGHIWKGNYISEPVPNAINWRCLNDNQKIQTNFMRLIKLPNGKMRLIVIGDKTGFYSDDDGFNWVECKGFDDIKKWGGWKRAILKEGSNVIYALGNEWDYSKRWTSIPVIYSSKDFGVTFKKIDSDTSFKNYNQIDIFSQKYGSGKVYVVKKDLIYDLSPNDTLILRNKMNFPKDNNIFSDQFLTGTETSNGIHFYILRKLDSSRIYSSNDNGKNFEGGTAILGIYNNNSYTASTMYPNQIFTGAVDLWKSFVYGDTNFVRASKWDSYYGNNAELPHADIQAIIPFREKNNEVFAVGTDGGIFFSRDSLKTFRNLTLFQMNNAQYYSVYTLPYNNDIIYAGAQDQGLQRCMKDSIGILNFKQLISGDYGQIVSSNQGVSIWYNYPGFTVYYPKAGEEPFVTKSSKFITKGQLWIPQLAPEPLQSNVCWLAGGDDSNAVIPKARLWKLTYANNDITWQKHSFDFGEGAITAIGISTLNRKYRYVITDKSKFFTSIDDGQNWTKTDSVKLPDGHYFYGNAILPSEKKLGRIFVAGSGYSTAGVLVSEDNGKTFTAMNNDLPKTLVYAIASDLNEEYLFAATEIGPYIFSFSSKKWSYMGGSKATDAVYWSVQYLPKSKTVRFGTYARGIWDFVIEKKINGTTDVKSENKNDYKLNVYPNPVKDDLNINFMLTQKNNVIITFYDLAGKKVHEIVKKDLQIGVQNINWNSVLDNGTKLPNGNYICIVSIKDNVDYSKFSINR
ncbi:MAG: T9SS type A sorting domain-containing protein [Chlorobi bacterium]|nr:T9SS type A sorting domain-containing protein [Chlorobiota bacterium]